MAPMGTFCFALLILKNPPMEIGEIIGIYVAYGVLTNTRLGFWGTLSNFFTGQNFRQDS